MAARSLKATGGNWNSTGTWNEGAVPVAGDTVTCSGGGNLTVTANAACASIDFTGFSNTFTINSAITLTVTSTFLMVSGMSVGGSGNLTLNGTLTMTSGGKVPAWNVTLQGANTYTLGDSWQIGGTVTLGSGANNITLNGNSITANNILNTVTSGTVSGTTKIVAGGTNWNASGGGTITNNLDVTAAISIGTGVKYSTGTLRILAPAVTAGTFSFTGSLSLDMTGMTNYGISATITVAATITLLSDVLFNILTLPNANATFAGAFDVYCQKLTNTAASSRTYTFVSGQTLYVGILTVQSSSPLGHHSIVASSPGARMKLNIDQTRFPTCTQDCVNLDLTDVDATPGLPCIVFGSTQSNCLNCQNSYPPPNFRRPVSRLAIGR